MVKVYTHHQQKRFSGVVGMRGWLRLSYESRVILLKLHLELCGAKRFVVERGKKERVTSTRRVKNFRPIKIRYSERMPIIFRYKK